MAGWSFSTDTDTYPIFPSGVSGDERSLFATNVAQFNTEYDLDGVDFDWEHLGAPDIPGIPAGSPTGGPNYLPFLKLVRAALPDDKSQLPLQPRIGISEDSPSRTLVVWWIT